VTAVAAARFGSVFGAGLAGGLLLGDRMQQRRCAHFSHRAQVSMILGFATAKSRREA
jgi:hypothetical protein